MRSGCTDSHAATHSRTRCGSARSSGLRTRSAGQQAWGASLDMARALNYPAGAGADVVVRMIWMRRRMLGRWLVVGVYRAIEKAGCWL